ncbi:uncharacterized protein EV420DRAFT_763924 [Desarmillaria tabescens]|uniref:Uncharacterized protein n=1 Tax=Armillaria tabescens TaxID=1929756 RepID=A0AA39JVW3_ARMTA|nr:uncharacterized protein EV420DRAFT_763924 [Desarmillaria tabescens]KAK0449768.1 hypothetical protein EV420DRAFT_763924 [Desarmillaria tabescens]
MWRLEGCGFILSPTLVTYSASLSVFPPRAPSSLCSAGPPYNTRLKTMILRSEQCPLDIAFELVHHNYNEDMAAQALSVIVEVSHRWKTLLLHASLPLLDLLKPARGKIPRLESLALNALVRNMDRWDPMPEDTRSVFVDAPRLETVALQDSHDLGNFKFPLHITHLAGCADSVPNLEIYQSLVECHLEGREIFGNIYQVGDDISLRQAPIHVFLPNVRRLFLSSMQLLAHLCLPSLEDLTFKFDRRDAPDIPLIMKEFISRSTGCSLTRLAVHSSDLDVSDQSFIQDTLLFMDTLVYLDIGHFWRLDNFFALLASDGFLPNLQHLQLSCFLLPSSQGSLNTMITSITSHSQKLRSVKIYCLGHDDVANFNQNVAPLQQLGQFSITALKGRDQKTSGT